MLLFLGFEANIWDFSSVQFVRHFILFNGVCTLQYVHYAGVFSPSFISFVLFACIYLGTFFFPLHHPPRMASLAPGPSFSPSPLHAPLFHFLTPHRPETTMSSGNFPSLSKFHCCARGNLIFIVIFMYCSGWPYVSDWHMVSPTLLHCFGAYPAESSFMETKDIRLLAKAVAASDWVAELNLQGLLSVLPLEPSMASRIFAVSIESITEVVSTNKQN